MVTMVKICGMTREADVEAAITAGADAVGFIVGFEYSPRSIPIVRAGELIRNVPSSVDSVLVTTTKVLTDYAEDVKLARPSAIQIYGDPVDPVQIRETFGVHLIRPYLLKSADTEEAKRVGNGFDALLTDTYQEGRHGGTGAASDWAVCSRIRVSIEPLLMILSGGLNPGNVEAAVRQVRPYAVDASSGVEASPGLKDAQKVREFVRRAKGALETEGEF